MRTYDRLEQEERQPKRLVDHSRLWEKLEPVASVNGQTAERLQAFCDQKRITVDSLTALGTRVRIVRSGQTELVFAGVNNTGSVTAIKYRPISGSSHDSYAEAPSTWLRPIVVGKLDSLDWFVAEGETDTARLFDLVGEAAAILCLPAGAKTFRREWGDQIPRGATVYLCHDGDEHGDPGADKAAQLLGGKTVRVHPPEGVKDWCEWQGDREQFVELVAAARAEVATPTFLRLDQFLVADYPQLEVLLGDPETIIYLSRGTFAMTFGDAGDGKSTLEVDACAHLAAGCAWLGIPVPRPARVLIIENENAPALFQQQLADKLERWDADPSWRDNVYVYAKPWGRFTFASADDRRHLRAFCDDNRIDLIFANPLFGVGGPGSGRPDETSAFVDLLKELGLGLDGPAIWPMHHENKLGQISGDWKRQPDTVIQLDSDTDKQETKLTWDKVRWIRQRPEGWRKKWLLEWVPEHKGYNVLDVDLRAVSDEQLRERVDAFLDKHPRASTKTILERVEGNAARLRQVLKSGRYAVENGPRGANLYSLSSDLVLDLEAEVMQLPGNAHE
jgi:hypothetical protein